MTPQAQKKHEWENVVRLQLKININNNHEDTFTIFEILTWLPDFHIGMDPCGNVTACAI